MKVMVLGAGALGGYFGARLQEAGHDVAYVARGEHLAAMQADGLRVESPLGDIRLPRVHAVADPREAGPADLVLFMVKTYDAEAAARSLKPVMRPETLVITAQNGVSAQPILAEAVGRSAVLPGAVYMPADIRAPGVIRHSAAFHRIVFGPWEAEAMPGARDIRTAFTSAGLDAQVSEDIWALLWQKFVMMAANSAITTLTRLDIGPIRETPETLDLLRRLVDETFQVARATHPSVGEDAAAKALDFLLREAPPTMHASMLDDLRRGKRLELPWLSGEVVRRGRALGIDTPAHEVVVGALMPYAQGNPAA
ncbi:2-dehydropantoate 2-reductase [Silicimonas algicola]|uniref:2-dehydropantoate 2-reductase n=1 Tax=Silicimonas algicola TaxID=1826607 RepID=A0A316G7A3_9RHOB|nr:2-dehydropantoate 2-reductase [Silicimonas algicola]AZQ68617.1 2-dehydropantoate 2-reductase [Silicimonas algicola]PWK55660.1 ketopantoate reductase [Silicimonas algicola]